MKKDLFISYAHSDDAHLPGEKGFVTQFVERLKADYARTFPKAPPLVVFIDHEGIKGMDDWRHRIVKELRDSRLFVAFVSPNYAASEYCLKEFAWWANHEMHKFVLGEDIAPIYVVEVPGYLNDPPSTLPWIQRLTRVQTKYDIRPFATDGIKNLELGALDGILKTLQKDLKTRLDRIALVEEAPRPHSLPEYNTNFVGRREELLLMRHGLLNNSVAAVTAVQGVGGIGKSEMAFTYAHAFAWDYQVGRFYVPCDSYQSLDQAISQVGSYMQIAFTDEENANAALKTDRVYAEIERQSKELEAAGKPHRALIILDNISDKGVLGELGLAKLPRCVHAIATTRIEPRLFSNPKLMLDKPDTEEEKKLGQIIQLEYLHPDDALTLLDEFRPITGEDESEAAQEIVRRLDGFTLAVEVVGVYLRDHGNKSYRNYLTTLAKDGIDALDTTALGMSDAKVRHHEAQVGMMLRHSFADLLTPDSPETEVLKWASLFAPDVIPLPWVRELTATKFPSLLEDTDGAYDSPWQAAIEKLDGLRFLTNNSENTLGRMHKLVREAIHIEPNKHVEMEADIRQLLFLAAMRPPNVWFMGSAKWEMQAVEAFVGNKVALIRDKKPIFWSLNDIEFQINTVGDIKLRLGDLPTAKSYFEQGLDIAKSLAQSQPASKEVQRDLSISFNKIGDIAVVQGDLLTAKNYFELGFEIRQSLVKLQRNSVLAQRDLWVSLKNLGNVAAAQGDLSAATSHFERGLKIAKVLAEFQPDNLEAQRDLLTTFNMIGEFARSQVDIVAAKNWFELGFEISLRMAQVHPNSAEAQRDLWVSLSKLGVIAIGQCDLYSAMKYFELGLRIAQHLAQSQPDNAEAQRDLVISHSKMAGIFHQLVNQQDAVPHLMECHKLLKKMRAKGMHLDPQTQQLLDQLNGMFGE